MPTDLFQGGLPPEGAARQAIARAEPHLKLLSAPTRELANLLFDAY